MFKPENQHKNSNYRSMTMAATAQKTTFIITILFAVSVQWMAAQNYPIAGDYIDQNSTRPVFQEKQKSALTHDGDIFPHVQPAMSMMMGPVLHDQSELVNYPGAGSGGADVSAITGNSFGFTSSVASNIYLADEFIVPPGELWLIDSIELFHYQTGSTTSSTINDIRLQISNGALPGTNNIVFGDLTTNRLNKTAFSGIYRIQPPNFTVTNRPIMKSSVVTPALALPAGTYWIENMAGGTLASGPFTPPRTLGTTHIATGNQYQYNGSWIAVVEFNAGGSNPLPKGMPFVLYGTSIPDLAARLNGIDYISLQDAIDAVSSNGEEITLLKNVNEAAISVGPYSVIIKGDGFNCTLNQINIANGKYLQWVENTLNITGNINNNTTGILWNNSTITGSGLTNTGIIKGTGTFSNSIANSGKIQPGN